MGVDVKDSQKEGRWFPLTAKVKPLIRGFVYINNESSGYVQYVRAGGAVGL